MLAVRSAISAEVHSNPQVFPEKKDGCSLCHFGRGSQLGERYPRRLPPLFALPFRQRFTAFPKGDLAMQIAVRSAISAEVHSQGDM